LLVEGVVLSVAAARTGSPTIASATSNNVRRRRTDRA
jgi:hypothetical protein